MFKFIVLILAFMVSARAELPPTRAAGQGESLKPAFNLYFPPSTVSDMGGINKFIDTGSENLLVNSGFEAQTVSSGWTISNATTSAGTAFKGLKSLSLSLTGLLSLSQEITATQYYPNVVSFSLWVKSSITDIQLCSTLATVEQECVSYDGSDQWKKLQVLVTAPSSGAMGLKLKSLTSTSGTVLVDAGEFSSDPLKFKNQEIVTDPVSYTPTFVGFGTPSTVEVKYSRSGKYLIATGSVVSGTVSADIPTFTLPTGLEVDTSSISVTANTETLGVWQYLSTASSVPVLTPVSAAAGVVTIDPASPTVLKLAVYNGPSNAYGFLNATSLWSSGSRVTFNIKVPIKTWSATQSQILTANDVVSSETINWQFKSTAITDCGGADPIGTYNTYSKAASSNTFSLCGTAPATTPNNNDGFYMQALSFPNTGTCGGTGLGKVAICIGKGLRGYKLKGYQLPNRGGQDIFVDGYANSSATNGYGMRSTYNEKTGILILDSARSLDGSETVREFQSSTTNTTYSNAYVHFAASKNPVISALDAVPRIDFSWENEFGAVVAQTANTVTACTSSPCVSWNENVDWISSVTRSGVGTYVITYTTNFFSVTPVCVATPNGGAIPRLQAPGSASSMTVYIFNDAGALADDAFNIKCSRGAGDYRSRGDAAAIISSPVCYARELSTDSPASSADTIHTRALNNLDGACSGYSLSSNQLTIPKGTYVAEFCGYTYRVNYSSIFLYNITDSSYISTVGQSDFNFASDAQARPVCNSAYFTLTSEKTIELRQWTQSADADGLGNNVIGTGSNPTTTNRHSWIKLQRIK